MITLRQCDLKILGLSWDELNGISSFTANPTIRLIAILDSSLLETQNRAG